MLDPDDLKVLATLLTAIAAVFGLFLVVFRIWFERRVKMDEFLIQSLPLFGGGTQKRNVAIGVTEGYCQKSNRFRSIIVPVLINQAIYLLFSKTIKMNSEGKKFAAHEKKNIQKVIELLDKLVDEKSLDPKGEDYRRIRCEYDRLIKDQTLDPFSNQETT